MYFNSPSRIILYAVAREHLILEQNSVTVSASG
jgi:hypothetical protein